MSKSQSIKIVSNLGGAKMATYTNAMFIGFGTLWTCGTYISELLEVMDATNYQIIATYYSQQEIEFGDGMLGSCMNQLTVIPASVFWGIGIQGCSLDAAVMSTWQI